mmetsp:Transcript_48259/g.120822  ORF Transcript_48259/g.120822 Transcript_48259/m.120822 type:complete len:115 (-) Transcript_48259:627-971(-)
MSVRICVYVSDAIDASIHRSIPDGYTPACPRPPTREAHSFVQAAKTMPTHKGQRTEVANTGCHTTCQLVSHHQPAWLTSPPLEDVNARVHNGPQFVELLVAVPGQTSRKGGAVD